MVGQQRHDEQYSALDEAHDAEDAKDAVPIREPACDRRTGDIRDRDNRDDRRSSGGRTPDSPDDVENDEALQTREAELPECVHDTEDAQARVPSQQRTKRRRLIREDRSPAAGFEPEDRQQGQRRRDERGGGDQERERLPDAEQETTRPQRRAETDTARDCLYGLRAGVEPSRQEVGVEGPVRRGGEGGNRGGTGDPGRRGPPRKRGREGGASP